jgi:hypothetical protein
MSALLFPIWQATKKAHLSRYTACLGRLEEAIQIWSKLLYQPTTILVTLPSDTEVAACERICG